MVVTDKCDKVVPVFIEQLGRDANQTLVDSSDVAKIFTTCLPLKVPRNKRIKIKYAESKIVTGGLLHSVRFEMFNRKTEFQTCKNLGA